MCIIYPNPTTGIFNIISNSPENATILIYDASGQIIAKYEHNKNTQINISSNNRGIYLVKIISSDGIYSQKIILQ